MKILRTNRGEGKTTELIKLSHDTWTYILCKDRQRVELIDKIAMELNIDIPFPITVAEMPLSGRSRIKSVLIDDMEDVLQAFIRLPIDLATTSCDIIGIEDVNKLKPKVCNHNNLINTEYIRGVNNELQTQFKCRDCVEYIWKDGMHFEL